MEMFNDINPPSAISDYSQNRGGGIELIVIGTQMKSQGRNDGHLEQYIEEVLEMNYSK